jgi:hypothetical protein
VKSPNGRIGHRRISNTNHGSLLPPSWRTLYEFTKLDDGAFGERIARPRRRRHR